MLPDLEITAGIPLMLYIVIQRTIITFYIHQKSKTGFSKTIYSLKCILLKVRLQKYSNQFGEVNQQNF